MQRKIVVIGMDNTGKTTLVNQLSHDFDCKSIKSPGPDFTREEMLDKIIKDLEMDDVAILERFSILEELVYGNVLRNHSKFEYTDMEQIRKYNPLFVYCRPSDEDIYNFGDREQMVGVIEEKDALVRTWDSLIEKLELDGYDIFKYNWRNNNSEEILDLYNKYYLGERGE